LSAGAVTLPDVDRKLGVIYSFGSIARSARENIYNTKRRPSYFFRSYLLYTKQHFLLTKKQPSLLAIDLTAQRTQASEGPQLHSVSVESIFSPLFCENIEIINFI
jgi:hypothetical protein